MERSTRLSPSPTPITSGLQAPSQVSEVPQAWPSGAERPAQEILHNTCSSFSSLLCCGQTRFMSGSPVAPAEGSWGSCKLHSPPSLTGRPSPFPPIISSPATFRLGGNWGGAGLGRGFKPGRHTQGVTPKAAPPNRAPQSFLLGESLPPHPPPPALGWAEPDKGPHISALECREVNQLGPREPLPTLHLNGKKQEEGIPMAAFTGPPPASSDPP